MLDFFEAAFEFIITVVFYGCAIFVTVLMVLFLSLGIGAVLHEVFIR
jgi:hypothetical protein